MPQPNSVPAFLSMFEPPSEKSSTQKTIEKVLSETEGSARTARASSKASSANMTITPKRYVNRSASASNNFSLSPKSAKKRFADPPVKSSKMGTLKRLTKKYSKSCKKDNLLHLLNWKDQSWNYEKGITGEIYDNDNILTNITLPDGSDVKDMLHNVIDMHFPPFVHDHFTKSLYEFEYEFKTAQFKNTPKLKSEVLTENNPVQLWKLLDKKNNAWHVCCVIWHNNEPYSFGFDRNVQHEGQKHPELAVKSPSGYLEIALIRQKIKNPNLNYGSTLKKKPKYLELLATGVLDTHMITQLTKIFTKSTNKYELDEFKCLLQGFEEKDTKIDTQYKKHLKELEVANKQWKQFLEEKAKLIQSSSKVASKNNPPEGYSYSSTRVIPLIIEHWKKKPFQLEYSELIVSFRDFYYCRKDPGRNSKKKNCMGALDSLFQDLFSCRLFGTYIHPKLCGPKKKCFRASGDNQNSPSLLINTNINNTERSNNIGNLNVNVNTIVNLTKKNRGKSRSTVVGGGKKRKSKLLRKKYVKNKN